MAKSKRYFRFTENNENEGENWNFYVPLTEAQREKLAALINGSEAYFLSDKPLTEEAVYKKLRRPCRTGYMCDENKCSSKFKLPEKIDWDNDDPFYKGQFWDVVATNGGVGEDDE